MVRQALTLANCAVLLAGVVVVAVLSPSSGPDCVAWNCCDQALFGEAAQAADPYSVRGVHGLELPWAYPPWATPILWIYRLPHAGAVLAAFSTGLLLWAGTRADRFTTALIAAMGGWTFFNALLGQTGLLIGAGALMVAAARRDRDMVLGAVGWALVMLKPQYGLILAFALPWRSLALGTLLLLGASLPNPDLLGWVDAVLAPHPELDASYMVNHAVLLPTTAYRWPIFGVGLVLAPLLRRRLGALVALALFVSPHAHPYDLALWAVVALDRPRLLLGLGGLVHLCLFTGLRFVLPMADIALFALALRSEGPEG